MQLNNETQTQKEPISLPEKELKTTKELAEIEEVKKALDLLKEGIAFVVFHFSDGSAMFTVTSLNVEVLEEFGAEIRPGSFFDLVKHRYIKFRTDACNIEVSADDFRIREVDLFANKYV